MSKVAVPMYIYPGNLNADWDRLLTRAKSVGFIVVNPGSGPGNSADANYTRIIATAKAAGIKVLGYTTLDYFSSSRPMSAITADISKWYSFYPAIDGQFLDEHPSAHTTTADLNMRALNLDIRGRGGMVCVNPGSVMDERYFQHCDWACVSESAAVNYLAAPARPAWEANYSSKLWHIVHSCPPTQMAAAMARTVFNKAAYAYITDDVMANPFDKLPTYWTQLCDAVDATNPPPVPPEQKLVISLTINDVVIQGELVIKAK